MTSAIGICLFAFGISFGTSALAKTSSSPETRKSLVPHFTRLTPKVELQKTDPKVPAVQLISAEKKLPINAASLPAAVIQKTVAPLNTPPSAFKPNETKTSAPPLLPVKIENKENQLTEAPATSVAPEKIPLTTNLSGSDKLKDQTKNSVAPKTQPIAPVPDSATSPNPASSLPADQKNALQRNIDNIVAQGVPLPAATRMLEFINRNKNKHFHINRDGKTASIGLTNQNWAAVIDYSKPSTEKRMFLVDLKTFKVEKYFVAHGVRSGALNAVTFSNRNGSEATSLGLFVTGEIYYSQAKHRKSIRMYGIERSNDQALARAIVIHGAQYVSAAFVKNTGRLGRSQGCPAVSLQDYPVIQARLAQGAVVYSYHKDLIGQIQTSPTVQLVAGSESEHEAARSDEANDDDSVKR